MMVSNLVLGNLPQTYNQDRIKDFVEGTLDLDVKNVVIHHSLQGTALVTLCSEIDFATASESLKEFPIEKQVVDVQETTEKPFTVVVQDVEPECLSEEFLEIYFCAEFGDGEDIVISCQMVQNLKMAVVTFKSNSTIMSQILAEQDQVPLPSKNYHILVGPYYTHFHDSLSQQSDRVKLKEHESFDSFEDQEHGEDYNSSNHRGDEHSETKMEEDTSDSNDAHKISEGKDGSDPEDEQDEQEEETDNDEDRVEDKFYDSEKHDLGSHKFPIEKEVQSPPETKRVSFHRGNFRGRKMFHNRNTHHQNRSTKHPNQRQVRDESNDSLKGGRSKAVQGRGNVTRKMMPSKNRQRQENFKTSVELKDEEESMSFDYDESDHAPSEIFSQQTYTRQGRPYGKVFESDYQSRPEQWNTESMLKPFTLRENVGKTKSSFLKHCIGGFGDCTVRYDFEHEVFLFDGTEECVRQKHLMLLTDMKKIKEEVIQLTLAMIEILSSTWQQQCIANLSDLAKRFECKVFFEKPILKILAYGEENLKSSLEVINAEISGSHLIRIQESVTEINFQNIKWYVESKFAVIISLKKEGILIEGMKEDVKRATGIIDEKLHNVLTITEKFEVVGPKVVYFENVLMNKISALLKDVETAVQTRSDKKISLTVTGIKPHVKEAMKKLESIMSTIHSKSWNLNLEFPKKEDLKLVIDSLSKSPQYIHQFEKTHHCSVACKLSKSVPFPLPHSHKSRDSGTKTNRHTKPKKQPFSGACPKKPIDEQQNPLVYMFSNTCQLVLQLSAKITQENSSVLVCVLDDKVDLRRTNVGKDFQRACPTLWKTLQEVQQGSAPGTSVLITKGLQQGSAPGTSVLVTKGPFTGLPPSCQAVYYAILSKWAPGSSETALAQVINTIINNASISGITSISIPPLGPGRLLGFPSQSVAKIMIQVLCSTVPKSSLKRVVLLADSQLIRDYKGEAQKALSVAPVSANTMGGQPQEGKAGSDENSENNDSESEETESSDDESANGHNIEREANIQPQIESSNSVTMWTEKEQNLDRLWAILKKTIGVQSLHVDYFNQSEFKVWPKHFLTQILSKRHQNSVWIENCQNPKTNMASFMVKGEKHDVDKVMVTITWEYKLLLDKQPKRITSSKAKRGTLEFIQHAASCNEPIPSYWNMTKKDSDKPGYFNKFMQRFKGSRKGETNFLVDVNHETKKAIEKLVQHDLFDPQLIGNGNDAFGLNHKGIQVTDVKRVENPVLFEPYNMSRNRLFQQCCTRKQICQDIGKISGSKGRVNSTEKLPNFMKTELYWEINEHYLFHGSQKIKTLVTSGPDPRVGSEGGMFGRGFYLAERTTKADQYADSKSNRSPLGTPLTLIMFRALLGNTFLCDHNHRSVQSKTSVKLSRPPCMTCKEDKCDCSPQPLYDSVMGDGRWNFREFVLYDLNLCYPEYIITYKRV